MRTKKDICFKELYENIKANNLTAIIGKNGIGKSYSIGQLIYKYYNLTNKRSVLLDTRYMGTDKNGYVGEEELGKIVSGLFEKDRVSRMIAWSHGQGIADDIVQFLLKTADKPVVFIDEPETALDFEIKQEVLKVFNVDKFVRPIVIATNCPFFILKSDIVFELTEDKLTKWTEIDFSNLRNKLRKVL